MAFEKHISRRGLPLVISGDKSRADGIFSSEVFGVVDKDRYEKTAAIPLNTMVMRGWALAEFKRLDRVVYECATTRGNFLINENGELSKIPKDYEKTSPREMIGYGPHFLYNNWDRINKQKFNKVDGKLANVLMSNSVSKYKRDELFTAYQFVPSIGFREEEQDSMMVFNELNVLLVDIAKFSGLIRDNTAFMETADLKVYVQNKVFELYELTAALYGSKGKIRSTIISRTVDNGSRGVILPATFNSDIIGESRFKTDSMGFPIYHINKMYPYVVKKYFGVLVEMLYDHGYFDPELSKDRLAIYDMDYIEEAMKKFEDPFFKVQPFQAIRNDGTFGVIDMDFVVDGEEIKKPLTWIEFFYIALYSLADLENKRYSADTRYPVDSDKSCQILRPVILTLTDRYLKTVSFMVFDNVKYFPFITEELTNRYDEKIFETGYRIASTVAVAWNGKLVALVHGNMCSKVS